LACPTRVDPVMPQRARRDGIEGAVRAEAVVRDGKVTEVRILSGHPVFHTAVRQALLQYQCARQPVEGRIVQDFVFRLQ